MFPEDSIQSYISPSPWWIEATNKAEVSRGTLIKAFVPYVDQMPHKFVLKGRKNPEEHGSAKIEIAPLRITEKDREVNLPVAAMTLPKGELWTAYRAKKRPCIVLSDNTLSVDKEYTKGKPASQTAPVLIVAPYYGADEDGSRAGYRPKLVEQIKHAIYPQLFLDRLPLSGPTFSILRFDHIQPIGSHYQSYEPTGYRLGEDALIIMDEWLDWFVHGTVLENGFILAFQELIKSFESE